MILLLGIGIHFPLSNTRWQIAELIGRKKEKDWDIYLLLLINDSDKYVQRRALISLARIQSNLFEEVSIQKLTDEDCMIRLVALINLHENSTRFLEYAIKILENDPSELIQKELKKIRKKVDRIKHKRRC